MNNLKCTVTLEQAVTAWVTASKDLGFRITAPYTFKCGKESVQCLAFLPHFGGPNGMIIGTSAPPRFETDKRLIEYAQAKKMFCSFINLDAYRTYKENVFKEALADWGYFGPLKENPLFVPKTR
jgi:hypothetical protein